MVKAILTDIEGTTTSVSFVYDVLFPYAREHLPAFIKTHRTDKNIQKLLKDINQEVNKDLTIMESIEQLLQWMDEDRKVTPLKTLQGMVWEDGYQANGFQGHVYNDVPPNLKKWQDMGIPVYIYSSGSIKAQKLLFAHTDFGDLTPYLAGYFDTTSGNKKEHESYLTIANQINYPPQEILFLSDVIEELDAARTTGMQTCLLIRNTTDSNSRPTHPCANDFNQVEINR